MRYDSLEYICKEITTNGVVGVSIWDTGTNDPNQIGYREGTADECAEYVSDAFVSVTGTVVIKGWRPGGVSQVGGRKKSTGANVDFRWRLLCRGSVADPSERPALPVVPVAAPSPNVDATLAVTLALLQRDLADVRKENAELLAVLTEEPDEPDPAPVPAVPKEKEVWEDPKQLREMLEIVRDVFGGKKIPGPAAATMNGVPLPADATEEEAKLLRAYRKAKAAQPAAIDEFSKDLLSKYPPD